MPCAGEPFRPEDLGPLVEGQVGGHQGRSPLVALAEDLEEQFRPSVGQGHEAQFVDDEELEAGQLALQVEQPAFVPGFHEFVDQGGGGGEAHRPAPLAGGQAQSQGDVGLAGAAVADGNHVFTALDVLAPGQLHDQGFVHRGDGGEVEGVQALGGGEAGGTDPSLYQALVAVGEFQFGEPEQVVGIADTLGGALDGQFTVLPEETGGSVPSSSVKARHPF